MPAVAAVAIPAAAAVVGGIIQHKTAGNAQKAQQHSTDAALAYQQSRDALGDKRYNDAWTDYQHRHAAWEQRNFGGQQAAGGGGNSGFTSGPALAPGQLQLPGQAVSQAYGQPQQGQSLADVGGWSDWNRYLAPSAQMGNQ